MKKAPLDVAVLKKDLISLLSDCDPKVHKWIMREDLKAVAGYILAHKRKSAEYAQAMGVLKQLIGLCKSRKPVLVAPLGQSHGKTKAISPAMLGRNQKH